MLRLSSDNCTTLILTLSQSLVALWVSLTKMKESNELKVCASTRLIADYSILWKVSPCFSRSCVRACVKSLSTQLLPALAWLKCQWKRVRRSAPTSHIFEVKICVCQWAPSLVNSTKICRRHRPLSTAEPLTLNGLLSFIRTLYIIPFYTFWS